MPAPEPTASRCRRPAGRALAGVALALGLCFVVAPWTASARPTSAAAVAAARPAGVVRAQTSPSTTLTITTTANLLVGQTTAPAATTTTTTAPAVSVQQARDRADADTRRVWYIVGGLLGVALLLLILTVRYWYTTRPGQALTPRHARKLERKAHRGDDGPTTDEQPPVEVVAGGKHRSRRERSDQ